MMKSALIAGLLLFCLSAHSQNYYVYVAAESEDEVALINFDGKQAVVEETIAVGTWPAEIEGPHGINVSPDGKYWYLSLAHGNPYGTLYKYSTETNKPVGSVQLGLFPASMQISKSTGLLYCVNFDLHGDMKPSTVSVVDPEEMIEISKIETGVMPHGSRISPDGKFHYSVAMMSGELYEINTTTLSVNRTLQLEGVELEKESDQVASMNGDYQSSMSYAMSNRSYAMYHSPTKPTWVIPHPTNNKVYVAGNGSDEILEVDLAEWKVTDRLPTGKAPYNVDISPDGQYMVVTYKGGQETGVWNLKKGKEIARVKNTRKIPHGVSISSDSKYAFVSVEGIGGEPGTMDVIELKSAKKVASADMGKQAGGIIFWKMEE